MRRCTMRRQCGTCWLALCFLIAPAFPAHADDWPVARGPSHEPAPYRFDRGVLKRLPREYLEDTSACILYSGSSHLIEADGSTETVTHEITRLNGRKGIETLGEYRHIAFDPSCQKLILNEARIIKADGSIVLIEPRHLNLRDVSTDYQVYDRDKQLVISFPNLEVGDIYEVKWTTRGRNDEFFGKFFMRTSFGDDQYPVLLDELRVRLPRTMPFKYATVNGKLDPAVTEQGDYRLYHWRTTNRQPLPSEADRPSREDLRLEVACSTFASWDEVAEWKQKLSAECWDCPAEVQEIVKKVTRDQKTPLEKARALAYWVRRRVRYISVSSTGKGYTPRLPAQVLASRYGDCKDQAQLLALMLRQAGLDVSLASLGMLDDGQVVPQVPSPWASHAIVLVKIDGQDHWIDTTVTRAGWDFLPRSDRDRVVYITGSGKLRLGRTPAMTPADNRIEQTTEIQVQTDGTALCRRSSSYFGQSALVRRDEWTETPPGERRRLVTADLQDVHRSCRLLRLDVDASKLADLDQPVLARLEFRVPQQYGGDEGSVSDSNVWNRLLGYHLDPERKLPLSLGTPFKARHRYVIQLPLTHTWNDIPADQEVRSPWGWFKRTVKGEPRSRRLEVVFESRLEKTTVQPAEFARFQSFHDAVYKYYRVWLNPTPNRDLARAPALELLQQLVPERARAIALAKLYRENGKEADAYRVLRRAVSFYPGDRALWELAVGCAPTHDKEVKIYKEMVRRFPGEKKFAAGLGELLVNGGDAAAARKILTPLTGDRSAELRGKAHYLLARCAFTDDRAAIALKYLAAAGQNAPELMSTSEACCFKAELHEELEQIPEAIKAYQQALAKDADDSGPLLALIRLELVQEHRERAMDYVRRYTVAAENTPDRLAKAAELHYRMGRFDDAVELAGRAGGAAAQRLIGLVHCRRHEYEKGIDHLEHAALDSEVLEALLRGHLALGQLASARQDLDKIKSVKPLPGLQQAEADATRILLRRATLGKENSAGSASAEAPNNALDALVCAEYAHEAGQPRESVEKLLSVAFKSGLEIGQAYALRGLLALEKGRISAALADGAKAVTLCPRESLGFLVRGRARLERDDAGALVDLEKAAVLSERKDATILHWLAAAEFHAGRHADALRDQRLAVKLKPRDAEISRQLQEFERTLK